MRNVVSSISRICPDTRIALLALPGALPGCKGIDIPVITFKDFLNSNNYESAKKYGTMMLASNKSANNTIPDEESIAYLGLSYLDLVTEHGEIRAETLIKSKGRQSFYPINQLREIIKSVEPR